MALTQIRPARAIYVDRISAGIIEARFRIEKQAFGAQLLLGYPINALDVSVALILHRIAAVPFWTRCGWTTFRRELLLRELLLRELTAIQPTVKQLIRESAVLSER